MGVDGRPLDYFANAQYLTKWRNQGVTGQLNHSIEVYWFDNSTYNYNIDSFFYADTASTSDGAGIAGDWRLDQSTMWNWALKTSAASGDITW
jgi:hypothetical protein